MMRNIARLALLGALVLAPFAMAKAGTVRGTVKNGTTAKLAAGIDLTLVQLQGGMQEVAHAKSGAQGEFTFDHPGIGTQPMLVRASYHGINFNQAVPPGTSTVQVNIFEPSKDAKTITIPSHVVIFQPNGATLIVGEEYQIENKSQPPQAYFRADAIAFAFRPGENSVRYSYELPYARNAATVKIPTVYSGARLLIVAPPSVQITGDGLAAGGQEQGMNLYSRGDVPAGTLVAVNVSGTAPPPGASAGAEPGPQGRDAQQSGGESAGVSIQQVPGRLDVLKWPLILGFVCVFGLLAILLARRPVVAIAGSMPAGEDAPAAKPKKSKANATSAPPESGAPGPTNGPASMAEVDAAIGTSLDALKERLFRLELRRQAGTISEAEYAQERARAEKVLRDLVRG